jgi:hypothetical protein
MAKPEELLVFDPDQEPYLTFRALPIFQSLQTEIELAHEMKKTHRIPSRLQWEKFRT